MFVIEIPFVGTVDLTPYFELIKPYNWILIAASWIWFISAVFSLAARMLGVSAPPSGGGES